MRIPRFIRKDAPVSGPSAPPPSSDPWAPPGAGFSQPEPARISPRTRTLSYAGLATALLLAILVFLPAPFVIESPGPTFDTLGVTGTPPNTQPVIEISGARTYPTTGQLRLVTVLQAGGPGQGTTVDQVLQGWWRSDTAVSPRDVLYPSGVTQQEEQQQASLDMSTSQENATYAALTELGEKVPYTQTITIAGTPAGSGAAGVVKSGDVITSVDGTAIKTTDDLTAALAKVTPGDTVALGVTRDDKPVDLTVTTGSSDGRTVLGVNVVIQPHYDFPVKVTFNLANVGGPSAGTMFALGIIDKLTPEDMTGGQRIAGTGTMDTDGDVGAIGGIRQKMAGSRRDGATWFLAPKSNCNEVVGHVPSGMHVLAVSTLHEAREDVLAIGRGTASGLPTCQGP
jgi:PDZ domain-containing protein